ncbi:MAG TPA: Ig-like domain-containing protein, partial [Solirubrobacteraceae bacterium]|nr:Ig-like domain-containing protein [Solirubrobacteraceae bacterium]
MFVLVTARATLRSVTRRIVSAQPRASRRLRHVLLGAVGVCLFFSLTASARVETRASAHGLHAEAAAAPFPLSVRQVSARTFGGRIVGTAIIVNTGAVPDRPTTGLLAVNRGSGGRADGVLTFSIPRLASGSSKRVRFATSPNHVLAVASGTYKVLVCADVYSQIQRFRRASNCSPGGTLVISRTVLRRPTGAVPNTIIRTGLASVSRSTSRVFRFVSTVRGSTFECSLDGGPWLGCSTPKSYRSLVNGRHAFEVRAIGPSGKADPTPARATWIVNTHLGTVTLTTPTSGSTTNNNKPPFSGAAGTAPGDSATITVKVFSGLSAAGSVADTLKATALGGTWSEAPSRPLADGTYTAVAELSDDEGNTAVSAPDTFTIDTTPGIDGSGSALSGNPTTPGTAGAALGDPGSSDPPATYSVGGSVSGLSGTVVLEDNGGDDLSVSGNGPFVLATPVLAGAAYNVTVKSSPSGQTCTASNGSGTVASANITDV